MRDRYEIEREGGMKGEKMKERKRIKVGKKEGNIKE